MSRYPLCPCESVPLDGWCVTHGLWRAVKRAAPAGLCAFVAGHVTALWTLLRRTARARDQNALPGAMILALLAGCGTLPAAAYPAPPSETAAMHRAWVAAGFPACHDFALYVYEASEPERLTMCQRPRPSCLTSANPSPMSKVPLAVVSPEYPDGWRHEFWHSLETCAGWPYDHGHAGPQWQGPQKTAGIP